MGHPKYYIMLFAVMILTNWPLLLMRKGFFMHKGGYPMFRSPEAGTHLILGVVSALLQAPWPFFKKGQAVWIRWFSWIKNLLCPMILLYPTYNFLKRAIFDLEYFYRSSFVINLADCFIGYIGTMILVIIGLVVYVFVKGEKLKEPRLQDRTFAVGFFTTTIGIYLYTTMAYIYM